jgi:hypothetical protein
MEVFWGLNGRISYLIPVAIAPFRIVKRCDENRKRIKKSAIIYGSGYSNGGPVNRTTVSKLLYMLILENSRTMVLFALYPAHRQRIRAGYYPCESGLNPLNHLVKITQKKNRK